MSYPRRRWPKEMKLRILAQVKAGQRVAAVAREYDISAVQIYQWQRQFAKYGDEAFAGNGSLYTDQARIAELERKVGQLTMENDLLKKAQQALMQQETPKARKNEKS